MLDGGRSRAEYWPTRKVMLVSMESSRLEVAFMNASPGLAVSKATDLTNVSNNPLTYTDPSGMFIEAAGSASAAGPSPRVILWGH